MVLIKKDGGTLPATVTIMVTSGSLGTDAAGVALGHLGQQGVLSLLLAPSINSDVLNITLAGQQVSDHDPLDRWRERVAWATGLLESCISLMTSALICTE